MLRHEQWGNARPRRPDSFVCVEQDEGTGHITRANPERKRFLTGASERGRKGYAATGAIDNKFDYEKYSLASPKQTRYDKLNNRKQTSQMKRGQI